MYTFTPLNMPKLKTSRKFVDIDDFFAFAKTNQIYLPDWQIERIRNGDNKKENGVLYSTSYGELRKGERQMTWYTSF